MTDTAQLNFAPNLSYPALELLLDVHHRDTLRPAPSSTIR